jgi:hypothetical protein
MAANYDQEIYNLAIQEGYTPIVAKLIVAQARLESANYTSNVLKCNNNMYGMKYVGQLLATRGTLAPDSEISRGCSSSGSGCNRIGVGSCNNGDYYAKFNTPIDSVRDTIARLYKITRKGVGFNELNSATDSLTFATLLKQRDYFGVSANSYAAGLSARLLLVNIIEFYQENKKAINYAILGAIIIGLSVYGYILKRKKII